MCIRDRYNVVYQHFLAVGQEAGFFEKFIYGFLAVLPKIIVSYVVGPVSYTHLGVGVSSECDGADAHRYGKDASAGRHSEGIPAWFRQPGMDLSLIHI